MIYHDIPAENPGKSIGTYGISSSNNFFHRMGMSHGLDNGFDIGFEPRKDLRTCQQTWDLSILTRRHWDSIHKNRDWWSQQMLGCKMPTLFEWHSIWIKYCQHLACGLVAQGNIGFGEQPVRISLAKMGFPQNKKSDQWTSHWVINTWSQTFLYIVV